MGRAIGLRRMIGLRVAATTTDVGIANNALHEDPDEEGSVRTSCGCDGFRGWRLAVGGGSAG